MRSRSIEIFLILTALNSHQIHAGGNEVGNGGNAVVCKGKPPQLLDLYEAKVLRNLEVDSEITGTEPFAMARDRLAILSKKDAKSTKVYLAHLSKLEKDIHFENDISLVPIVDSQHSFVPQEPNCEVKQLAVLRKKPLPGEKRVLVNNSIWKEMKPPDKMALLLHETIYEYLALLGESDSRKARYLVSYLMSSKFRSDTPEAYWKMIKNMKLPIYP